jgi:(2S)-methylsuccinyl-CoA dehydrogenase
MVGIMVTEPDYGSDVAGVNATANPTDDGFLVNGVKTWATFAGRADVLMLLARTDPDRTKGHRGLSVLIVEKPRAEGHAFAFEDGRGGKMEGRAIDTIGYRGMHSYEVAFDNWFVPRT